MDEIKIVQDAQILESNKKLLKQHNKKIQKEQHTRKYILELATLQGCYGEAVQIMDKYDRLLAGCTDVAERKHIAIMGITELHKLLNVQGALIVNGVEILPAIGKLQEIIY